MSADLIRMEHIDKFYGRVQALDDVNFTSRARRSSGYWATTARASRR